VRVQRDPGSENVRKMSIEPIPGAAQSPVQKICRDPGRENEPISMLWQNLECRQ